LALAAPGQEKAASQEKAADAKSKKEKREYRGRLPNYWTKLEISDEQRKRIYALQVASRKQSEELEKQVEEARAKYDALRKQLLAMQEELNSQLRAVLSEEQRARLVDIEAEAKQRAATKRKARETKIDDKE
jgi:hypothetical protein